MVEIPVKPKSGDPILAEWGAGVIDCLISRNWELIDEIERTDWESNPIEVGANRNVYDMFLILYEGEILPPSGADAQLTLTPEGSENQTCNYRGFLYSNTTITVVSASVLAMAVGGSSLQQQTKNLSTLLVFPSGNGKHEIHTLVQASGQTFNYYLWSDYTYPSLLPSRAYLRMSHSDSGWKGKVIIYGRRISK